MPLRTIRDLPGSRAPKKSVVTIGAFDGIHIGHRRILDEVVMLAKGLGVRGVVVTFDPHPLAILQPDEAPHLLTSLDEKRRLIEEAGMDDLVLLRFSPNLACQSAEWFVKNVLLKKLNMRRLVIGYDFRFGRDRQGDALYLESLGEAEGFGVDAVPPVNFRDHPVSSTRVRTALVRGDVESAARMLGRPYSFKGSVVRGEGRGTGLSYPTANIDLGDSSKMIPANGVYAVTTRMGSKNRPAVLYIGTRPTFGGRSTTIEAHVMGMEGNLYGKSIEVAFAERLRDETRFENDAELRTAIAGDVSRAKGLLSI
ncbi:MAG: bifunctional riboflavin kinase/FAD synthetase [Candidatus Eisenbacteria bacterium]